MPTAEISYIYYGGVWFGGVVGSDTLVTVALDDFLPLQEFTPAPLPEGEFIERTQLDSLKRPSGSLCPPALHDPLARSDQDLEVVYTDTVVGWMYENTDPWDERAHMPLHLSVKQRSSSWSSGYGEDITLIDYEFTNVGSEAIRDAYVGVLVDHDIGSFEDDWVGFVRDIPVQGSNLYRDTLNLAWCADNDGDPSGSTFGSMSPTRALGVRLLRTPGGSSRPSFNWWVGDFGGPYVWGPVLRRNYEPVICPMCVSPGVPIGDKGKYFIMTNGEIDYNQNGTALDHQADGWLPPVPNPQSANDIADGFEGRFLLSAGPFELPPGASEPLTLAVVAGQEFHVNPGAFAAYWDPLHPQYLAERLDFDGVLKSARWAGFLFDTPGFDTDGNGYAGKYQVIDGDTSYYAGDGVPDFAEPLSPPAPTVRATRSGHTLTLRWNGEVTETSVDAFLRRPDFEGYRVYLSRTGHAFDFALLCQRDVVDYLRREWHAESQQWLLRDTPFSLDSLQSLYGTLSGDLGFPFHPDSFLVANPAQAVCVAHPDPDDPAALDTTCYYFEPFDGNLTVDDVALATADSTGLPVTAVIRKTYPGVDRDDVWYDDNNQPFKPYFEYEYALDNIYPADAVHIAVTAFDFGNPQFGQEEMETALGSVVQLAYPSFATDSEDGERPRPGLYPNPYRLLDDYAGSGWENPLGLEVDPERARRITFYNLPDECKVTIWTLDGDLVKELHHNVPAKAGSDQEVWNLITRNGEKVRTGLYVWCVESRFGNDVGKLAVIR